ncbi:EamA family transporter [Phenylobacterium sp.]|jgi:undecaprenyl phosphate-alpha-L-ara4N flippase subunit ArnE|uniref:EamA family transporter n=1 Tax=Phenylobacterium sp. TaxID=1871053 RepID=UPI002F415F57
MSGDLTTTSLALLGFCILAEIGVQLSFKTVADGAGGEGFVAALFARPLLWAGLCLWAVELVAWILVLERTPLALAYPIMTLNFAAVPIAGALVLRERLSRSQVAGAALVAAGVLCVSLSGLR